MVKRFVARPKYNLNFIKMVVCFILVLVGFFLSLKLLFKIFIENNDSKMIDEFLAVSTNNLIGQVSMLDLLSVSATKPESLLKLSFSNMTPIEYKIIEEKVSNVSSEPLVYIYNTHQTEEYSAGTLSTYNITPTVYMAANILAKKLSNYGISSIVEDENIVNVLNENDWSYGDSYKVSRMWLDRVKKKYPSVKYFIDLHRDSATTRVTINDKVYAKMMFVVGMAHENYEENEALVLKLNEYLSNNYDGLMRDIFYGKRSQYNQDFDTNTFLVEVGGPENTIEEVYNSVEVLGEAIANVTGGI